MASFPTGSPHVADADDDAAQLLEVPIRLFATERDFNRRAMKRQRSTFQVSFRIGGVRETAPGNEMSDRGLSFFSCAKLTRGDEVELLLCQGGRTTSLRSVVRHVRGGKIGVRFERFTTELPTIFTDKGALDL